MSPLLRRHIHFEAQRPLHPEQSSQRGVLQLFVQSIRKFGAIPRKNSHGHSSSDLPYNKSRNPVSLIVRAITFLTRGACRMNRFYRRSHRRTNANGTTHWVGGHYVNRGDSNYPIYQSAYAQSLKLSDIQSFTIPNAICPRCGASVFFYRSPHGGAVFFDEIGPPWPKHPCTISESHSNTLQRTSAASHNSNTYNRYSWQKEGWHPAFKSDISKHSPGILLLKGKTNSSSFAYFFRPSNSSLFDSSEQPLIQVRQIDSKSGKIAFCWPHGKTYEVIGYLNPEHIPPTEAEKASSSRPTLQEKLEKAIKRSSGGVMKDALLAALSKQSNGKP